MNTHSTLGDMLDANFRVYVCCETWGCQNVKAANLEALAAKYGRDHGAMHWDLVKLPWRCDKCQGRKVSFRLEPGSKQYLFTRHVDEDHSFGIKKDRQP
jgi:hypothetical protein